MQKLKFLKICSTIVDIKNDVILEGDAEDLMIARLHLLPIASALRVSIMSVDYGEPETGMEATDMEAIRLEAVEVEKRQKKDKEREATFMKVRDMEAADMGSLDENEMLSEVSLTV